MIKTKEQINGSKNKVGLLSRNNVTKEKIVSGKILHLDGDRKYSEKSYRYYKKVGLNAIVKNIDEYRQSQVVYRLLEYYNPDILVITGHDGMIKKGTKYNDIYNYKDIKKMSLKYQERVEFLFVWTGLFGNFRRTFQSGMKFDEEYVKTYLELVNNYFPNWHKNKYLDTFIWDKDILELLINKDYTKIVNIYKEKYEVNTNKINNPKD